MRRKMQDGTVYEVMSTGEYRRLPAKVKGKANVKRHKRERMRRLVERG